MKRETIDAPKFYTEGAWIDMNRWINQASTVAALFRLITRIAELALYICNATLLTGVARHNTRIPTATVHSRLMQQLLSTVAEDQRNHSFCHAFACNAHKKR